MKFDPPNRRRHHHHMGAEATERFRFILFSVVPGDLYIVRAAPNIVELRAGEVPFRIEVVTMERFIG